MPLYRRVPKVGFTSRVSVRGENKYNVVRLSALQNVASGATVDIGSIQALGYAKKSSLKAGVKVLADNGEFNKKLHLKVNAISASARARVEAAGGTVEIIGE
jgi:large subunit ribosomal protein L15